MSLSSSLSENGFLQTFSIKGSLLAKFRKSRFSGKMITSILLSCAIFFLKLSSVLDTPNNSAILLVDKSFFIEENVHSVNPEHISIKIKRCFFKINNCSPIQLVIEGPENEDLTSNKHFLKPNDIYFETKDNIDINNDLIKKEIIVFLSLLN